MRRRSFSLDVDEEQDTREEGRAKDVVTKLRLGIL